MVTACVRTESFFCFLNQEIFAQQIAHVQVPAIRNAVPVSLQHDICGSNSITYATSRTIPPPTLQFSRSGTTSKHGRAYFSGSLELCLSLRVQRRWNKSADPALRYCHLYWIDQSISMHASWVTLCCSGSPSSRVVEMT